MFFLVEIVTFASLTKLLFHGNFSTSNEARNTDKQWKQHL